MSFTVDNFDDPTKWQGQISYDAIGTLPPRLENVTPSSFQAVVQYANDMAGLISVQQITELDISVVCDCLGNDSRLGFWDGGSTNDSRLLIERDAGYGEVFVWTSGVEFRMLDPVPPEQLAEMRIALVADPDTVTYPRGKIMAWYGAVGAPVLVFEGPQRPYNSGPNVPRWVFIRAGVASWINFSEPKTVTFQSPLSTPEPEPEPVPRLLAINSYPEGISVSIDGMSYTTPWSGQLEEGVYTVEMPSNVLIGGDVYNFTSWNDGDTNPQKTIQLTEDITLNANYALEPQTLTKLDVHAYLDGGEIVAEAKIVETGQTFNTPAQVEVAPGTYTVQFTYQGVTKTVTATVLEGQTIRVDGQLSSTPSEGNLSGMLIALILGGAYFLSEGT